MKLTETSLVIKTGNVNLLIGKQVKALTTNTTTYTYYRNDILTIKFLEGSFLRVENEQGHNFMIRHNETVLIDPLQIPTYCISCNTPYKNEHYYNCSSIQIDRMINENMKGGD